MIRPLASMRTAMATMPGSHPTPRTISPTTTMITPPMPSAVRAPPAATSEYTPETIAIELA